MVAGPGADGAPRLPSYITRKTIKPSRLDIERAVDPTGTMMPDEREYIALKLARPFPYQMNDDDEQWINEQLEGEPEPGPFERKQAAIRAFVRKTRDAMYLGDLIVDEPEPVDCSVCMGEVRRTVRPFCFNSHGNENVCLSCQIDGAAVDIGTKGCPARCVLDHCSSTLTQATLERLVAAS